MKLEQEAQVEIIIKGSIKSIAVSAQGTMYQPSPSKLSVITADSKRSSPTKCRSIGTAVVWIFTLGGGRSLFFYLVVIE